MPHCPTGHNHNLVIDDVFDDHITTTHKLERTSCVYINKPDRFVDAPIGDDEYPVS